MIATDCAIALARAACVTETTVSSAVSLTCNCHCVMTCTKFTNTEISRLSYEFDAIVPMYGMYGMNEMFDSAYVLMYHEFHFMVP